MKHKLMIAFYSNVMHSCLHKAAVHSPVTTQIPVPSRSMFQFFVFKLLICISIHTVDRVDIITVKQRCMVELCITVYSLARILYNPTHKVRVSVHVYQCICRIMGMMA